MRCGLTTPLLMQVLPTKRPNSCGIRARYCDALCAAMMTQFLLQLCAHSDRCSGNCAKLCARELHKVVRRYARVVRTTVVRLGDECTRLSFERAALCCARIHQYWFGPPSPMVVTYALVVAEPCAWADARRVAR